MATSIILALSLSSGPAAAGPGPDPTPKHEVEASGSLEIVTSALAISLRAESLDRALPPIELGSPPINVELPAGRWRISAEGPGYAPWTGELELEPGAHLRFQVEPELIEIARVELRPTNEASVGASVLVDGRALCELPCAAELEPGRHEFELSARRHKPLHFVVELRQADSIEIDVALEPAVSRAPALITGVVGLTSLGVAVGFTISAERSRQRLAADLDALAQYDANDRRIENGKRHAIVATSLYGVTAALGLLTLYYLLRQAGPSSRADLHRRSLARSGPRWGIVPALTPNGGAVLGVVEF